MIKVENLNFDYPGKRALKNISFEIEAHTITALVGPNGAGKTTLMRCLAGLESWTCGNIYIDGIEVADHPRDIHARCSYLSDFFGLYDDLTVAQSLKFIAMSRQADAFSAEKKALDVAQRVELGDSFHQKVSTLSRGLRQRLAIAQTIVIPPKVLFLDEPASGLDPESRAHLSELLVALKHEHMTIIVSSHILSELADYSTHMLKLSDGQIIKHVPLTTQDSIDKIYELVLSEQASKYISVLESLNMTLLKTEDNHLKVSLPSDHTPNSILKLMIAHDVPVESFTSVKQAIQELYLEGLKEDE